MTRFRYSVLANDVAKGSSVASGTELIDLPEAGILSEVITQIRSKKAYSDNTMRPDYHILTKIELLVNGSQVVKSLTGRQAMALMWYNGGPFETTNTYQAQANHNIVYSEFPLYLGRFAGDTKAGLDLKEYANPQLRLTWATADATIDGVAYDGNSSDPTFTYNVMAKVLDGTPAGFLNKYVYSAEVNKYNPVATGEKTTEIPRGYDLKGIMMGSRYVSIAWNAAFNNVKLDFDNGKWVPIDMGYANLAAAFKQWWPRPCVRNVWSTQAHNDNFDAGVMEVSSLSANGAGSSAYFMLWGCFEFPIYIMSIYDHNHAAYTTAVPVFYSVTGWGPMQTFYIPMSQLLDGEAETVDTREFGRIDLKISTSSASTSDTTRVVAEYLKPNGA